MSKHLNVKKRPNNGGKGEHVGGLQLQSHSCVIHCSRAPVATRAVNPGVVTVTSNPDSANFLSDDWQKSMRHASFVFHKWAKSMWKYHFIIECLCHQNLREIHIKRYYYVKPSMRKFIHLMKIENPATLLKLCKFIKLLLKKEIVTFLREVLHDNINRKIFSLNRFFSIFSLITFYRNHCA